MKALTHLEDATMRFVLAHAPESDGWLDLTRISSNTGRMLPDVRQSVARLERRGLLTVDAGAENTERWIKFVLPAGEGPPVAEGPRPAAP